MIGYKLLSLRKDGSVGPLFMDKRLRLPIGEWLEAKTNVHKKGFAFRPGWHILAQPHAPHLNSTKLRRVWAKVEFNANTATEFNRPANQGGKWFLAKKMRVLEILK